MTNIRRDFNKDAATWDENPARVQLANEVSNAIINNVNLQKDMNALDFGCGTGLLTLNLHEYVNSITGIDSSTGMLSILNNKLKAMNITNVKTLHIESERDMVSTGCYSLIVSSMTLHHVKDIQSLFKYFFASLNKSGILCIADLDSEDGTFHENKDGVFHFGFDREILQKTMIESGFENIGSITASKIVKPNESGESKVYTIFLMYGYKR